jgi:hypothetical protein
MTDQTKPEVAESDRDDFKMFMAFATQGILTQIPFGVNVEPIAVAQAAKNTAIAMVNAKNEAFK